MQKKRGFCSYTFSETNVFCVVTVMEGIFQRKGGVQKVLAMEHQVTRTMQLQALRGRLKARMSKKPLKLELT